MFMNCIWLWLLYAAQQCSVRRQADEERITADDLYHGLKVVQPSAMKELAIEKPNVSLKLLFDLETA